MHHIPANLSYGIWSANNDGQPNFFADPFRGQGVNFKPAPEGAVVLSTENFLTCPSHPTLRCNVAGYIAAGGQVATGRP